MKEYPRALYRKRYAEQHKAKGLCVACSQRAVVGKTRCIQCARLRWKQAKPCQWCGHLLSLPNVGGIKYHARCKRRGKLFLERQNWNRSERTPAYVEAHKRAAVAYQMRHKRKGLCRACPRTARGAYCAKHIH